MQQQIEWKLPIDAYYQCDNGIASAVKCPNGTVFDSATYTCAVGGICNKWGTKNTSGVIY